MKISPLLTTCSILLFSTQLHSQDTVNSGFGNSGFIEVEVDVPEDDASNDEQTQSNLDDPIETSGNQANYDNSNQGYITTNTMSWDASALSAQEQLSLIIIVCGGEPFQSERETQLNRVTSRYKTRPVERDQRNSSTSNRVDRDCPNQGNRERGDRNRSSQTTRESDRNGNCDRNNTGNEVHVDWNCSCCCHTSSTGNVYTTQSTYQWNDEGQLETSSNTYDPHNQGHGQNDQNPSQCDDKNAGIREGRSAQSDDCMCRCYCETLAGMLFYD